MPSIQLFSYQSEIQAFNHPKAINQRASQQIIQPTIQKLAWHTSSNSSRCHLSSYSVINQRSSQSTILELASQQFKRQTVPGPATIQEPRSYPSIRSSKTNLAIRVAIHPRGIHPAIHPASQPSKSHLARDPAILDPTSKLTIHQLSTHPSKSNASASYSAIQLFKSHHPSIPQLIQGKSLHLSSQPCKTQPLS